MLYLKIIFSAYSVSIFFVSLRTMSFLSRGGSIHY
ncbi:unnamed protein product [Spirodela intermedia]|uniref:Uncharacterized protein n=1 Tax=Spirodela intermedia TaxID=51605 RepID=A0A7I8KV83_SPIIN|nr:unnamed protein product [Spirodela intermedia]CAA7401018.1 unnamed protein product [Spirodela intermedia]CAA7401498.1 unnamed protein product [Spirodela intermedia]